MSAVCPCGRDGKHVKMALSGCFDGPASPPPSQPSVTADRAPEVLRIGTTSAGDTALTVQMPLPEEPTASVTMTVVEQCEVLPEVWEAVVAALDSLTALRAELAMAQSVADSMQHFADVAEVCERKSNEYATENAALRADRDALRERVAGLADECKLLGGAPHTGADKRSVYNLLARSLRAILAPETPEEDR